MKRRYGSLGAVLLLLAALLVSAAGCGGGQGDGEMPTVAITDSVPNWATILASEQGWIHLKNVDRWGDVDGYFYINAKPAAVGGLRLSEVGGWSLHVQYRGARGGTTIVISTKEAIKSDKTMIFPEKQKVTISLRGEDGEKIQKFTGTLTPLTRVGAGDNNRTGIIRCGDGRFAKALEKSSTYRILIDGGAWYVRSSISGGMPTASNIGQWGEDLKKTQADAVMPDFTDPRDEQVYRAVKIGDLVWMAENLNYKADNSWCHGNADSNCVTYGRLYSWNAAKTACPAGWHLPSQEECIEALKAIGDASVAATRLKSQTGWSHKEGGGDGSGTDHYGFSALPGGHREYRSYYYGSGEVRFLDVGTNGAWWSTAENRSGEAHYIGIRSNSSVISDGFTSKSTGNSVRCVKDYGDGALNYSD